MLAINNTNHYTTYTNTPTNTNITKDLHLQIYKSLQTRSKRTQNSINITNLLIYKNSATPASATFGSTSKAETPGESPTTGGSPWRTSQGLSSHWQRCLRHLQR